MRPTKFGSRSTIMVVAFLLVVSFIVYHYNHILRNDVEDYVAEKGYYSDSDNYRNITPMKHDIFKQLTIDVVVAFVIFFTVEIIGGAESFFDWTDFISFNNFKDFRLSIMGQSMLTIIGYFIYYQIAQPYIVNFIPKF
jgi:hypothetical protein